MANYRGHIAGGVVAGCIYATALMFVPVEQLAEYAGVLNDWQALAAVLVIAQLFALFPDVDTNSKAQDIFFWMVFPLDILLIWSGYLQAAAYLGLIAMLPIVTHHRGWTHRKWAMLLVPLPIILVPYVYNEKMLSISLVYYGAAVAGYFSHLLLDGLIWRKFRIKT
ncbi:MAG: metal-dependent hydrolase [Candidatus Saccharimonadales bacterium]